MLLLSHSLATLSAPKTLTLNASSLFSLQDSKLVIAAVLITTVGINCSMACSTCIGFVISALDINTSQPID